MPSGLSAVRVNVARGQSQGRIRGQQPASLRRKDIRVAPDFVNGPVTAAFVGDIGRGARPEPHWNTSCGETRTVRRPYWSRHPWEMSLTSLTSTAETYRSSVSPVGTSPKSPPPVGPNSKDCDVLRSQHQIRFADRPRRRVVSHSSRPVRCGFFSN